MSKRPLPLSHWNNPRRTIAVTMKDPINDSKYALTGFEATARILRFCGFSFDQMAQMTVLDYGCGTGRLTRPMATMFKEVHGFDPNRHCVQEAKNETFSLDGPQYILERIKFFDNFSFLPNESYDFIFTSSVLEHLAVPQKEELMAACLRKMHEGSILVHLCRIDGFMSLEPQDKGHNLGMWKCENGKLVFVKSAYIGMVNS